MAAMFGRWTADELRGAADIVREKGVPVCLLPDGSISIGASKPAQRPAPEESPPEPLPNAFSPATLAKRWHCSEGHIRNMIEKGQLGHFHLGGKLLRISIDDVELIENAASHATKSPSADGKNEQPATTQTQAKRAPAKRLDDPIMRARWKREASGTAEDGK